MKYRRGKAVADAVTDELDNLALEDAEPVDLNFFKTCVYDKANPQQSNLVKQNIKNSVKERGALFASGLVVLQVEFPCMIINVDLVRVT